MIGDKVDEERDAFWALFWACFAFFCVYTAIHIYLNLSAQGTVPVGSPESILGSAHDHPGAPTGWRKWVIDIAGPLTISICSSLLIFSYGTLLLHGRHISVSEPTAFIKAFLIFIYAQIIVQVCGHADIVFYNRAAASSIEGDIRSSPLYVFVLLADPVAFSSLLFLESYVARVFRTLGPQIPRDEQSHINYAFAVKIGTVITIGLLCLKLLIIKVAPDSTTFGVTVYTLVIEFGIAAFVVGRAAKRNISKLRY